MGLPVILLTLLLLRSALSNTDDSFEGLDIFNPEDDSDIESYIDRHARSGDKFLRFGKAFWGDDSSSDFLYDDKEAHKPSGTGRQEKNDQFIRFGRSKQDFVRLTGYPPQRTARDKSSFLRFGRSINDSKKKRDKREVSSASEALKRHENYLRFGRTSNSNFMRFGRNLGVGPTKNHVFDDDIIREDVDSRNKHILNYVKNLLRQSVENRYPHDI